MKLVEFKSVDREGGETEVFLNPAYVEFLYTTKSKDRVGISLNSGNSIEVNGTLESVKDKIGINIEDSAYRRIDKSH